MDEVIRDMEWDAEVESDMWLAIADNMETERLLVQAGYTSRNPWDADDAASRETWGRS